MTTSTLPLPVRFALPGPDWQPVDPDSLGVANAAFLAVRRNLPGDYTPVLTLSGGRRDDATSIEEIADESLTLLAAQGEETELVRRARLGSDEAPAVVQVLGVVATIEGRRRDLRQVQTVGAYLDVEDPTKRVVILYTLTCTYQQFDAMVEEYQRFMESVEVAPDQPDPGQTAGS